MTTWDQVAESLLGTWPGTVSAWGAEAISAFLKEVAARGIEPEQALLAIRTFEPDDPSRDFPPSAAKLAAAARRDPSRPTPAEGVQMVEHALKARAASSKSVWQPGERDRADEQAVIARAQELHPDIFGFITSCGIRRLRSLGLDDPQHGAARRKILEDQFREWQERHDERRVLSLVSGRGEGGLARLNPVAAIGQQRRELEQSSTTGGIA